MIGRMLSKVAHLARRVSLGRLASLTMFSASKRMLDRHGRVSYAQMAEDIVIGALVGGKPDGFYVDVGCNHPIMRSNTYLLYLRGFSGIAIDGNDTFASDFRRQRPRDTFVSALVGEGSEVEFQIFENDTLSKIGDAPVGVITQDRYKPVATRTERTRTLTEILDAHGAPRTFDLLSIDLEDHDFIALQCLDLQKYRPKLIVIEARGTDLGHIRSSEVGAYLDARGYDAVSAIKANLFFLAR